MIDSRWSAEVINNARHHDAYNPYKEINVDEPRFKSRLGRNHVRFQQGKHDDEENTGEHVCNKFCHTLKIHQSNVIDVNSLQKESAIQDLTGRGKPQPLRLGYIHASMAATLAFRGCLRADTLWMTHPFLPSTAYCLLHPPLIAHSSLLIAHSRVLSSAEQIPRLLSSKL